MKRSSGLVWVVVVCVGALVGCGRARAPEAGVLRTVQVQFVQPEGAKVAVELQAENGANARVWSPPLTIPGHMDLPGGREYSVRYTGLPGDPERTLQGRLKVEDVTDYTRDCAVPLELTRDDVEDAKRNVLVVKVVYLPDKEHQHYAIPGTPASVVSIRLEPGVDAVEEAKKQGKVLLVLRLGGREFAR